MRKRMMALGLLLLSVSFGGCKSLPTQVQPGYAVLGVPASCLEPAKDVPEPVQDLYRYAQDLIVQYTDLAVQHEQCRAGLIQEVQQGGR